MSDRLGATCYQAEPQPPFCAGDGSTNHLDQAVDLPGEIELQDGVYEVGREEPADVVIPVPTVSGRHALLRISEWPVTNPYQAYTVRYGRLTTLLLCVDMPLDCPCIPITVL